MWIRVAGVVFVGLRVHLGVWMFGGGTGVCMCVLMHVCVCEREQA